jgi:uncharacterized membrane protein YebE (DUF533 family)
MAIGDRRSRTLLYDIFSVIGVVVVIGVAYKYYINHKAETAAAAAPPAATEQTATVTVE